MEDEEADDSDPAAAAPEEEPEAEDEAEGPGEDAPQESESPDSESPDSGIQMGDGQPSQTDVEPAWAKGDASPSGQPTDKLKKPSVEKAQAEKSSQKAVVPTQGEAPEGGRFRETLWFMESVDPENLTAHDGDDPEAINAHYDREADKEVDEQTRRQFSLQANPAPTQTQVHRAVEALETAEAQPQSGGGRLALIAVAVILLLGAAGGAWYLLSQGG